MSIIVLAGSTPEPSSAPETTVPVPRPAAVPVNRASPAFRAPLTAKIPTVAGSTVPSARTLIGLPFWPRTWRPSWSTRSPLAAVWKLPSRE